MVWNNVIAGFCCGKKKPQSGFQAIYGFSQEFSARIDLTPVVVIATDTKSGTLSTIFSSPSNLTQSVTCAVNHSAMAESVILQTTADKIYERENELMQRFVRINLDAAEVPSAISAEEKQEQNGDDDGQLGKKIPARLVAQEITKRRSRKRRNRRSRQEEIYTDKDRAAAVNMGNKDIKQSLKLKRREDRSRNLMIPEEAEPGTFLALGEYEMKRGDLKIALNFINKV